MNERMGFEGSPLELKEEDFQENENMRQHFKLMLNAGLGKLAQQAGQNETQFVSTHKDISKLWEEQEITDIFGISDSLCQVNTKRKVGRNIVPSSSNPIIYAMITARTRILLHKSITLLERNNMNVYYCDCDSILFTANDSDPVPLDIGLAFGQFRSELGDSAKILSFEAHGRKNFRLTYKKNNKVETLFKLSGISLTSTIAHNVAINNFDLPPNIPSKKVPQIRSVQKEKLCTRKEIRNVKMRQDIFCQRRIDRSEMTIRTYPWGFKKDSVESKK